MLSFVEKETEWHLCSMKYSFLFFLLFVFCDADSKPQIDSLKNLSIHIQNYMNENGIVNKKNASFYVVKDSLYWRQDGEGKFPEISNMLKSSAVLQDSVWYNINVYIDSLYNQSVVDVYRDWRVDDAVFVNLGGPTELGGGTLRFIRQLHSFLIESNFELDQSPKTFSFIMSDRGVIEEIFSSSTTLSDLVLNYFKKYGLNHSPSIFYGIPRFAMFSFTITNYDGHFHTEMSSYDDYIALIVEGNNYFYIEDLDRNAESLYSFLYDRKFPDKIEFDNVKLNSSVSANVLKSLVDNLKHKKPFSGRYYIKSAELNL